MLDKSQSSIHKREKANLSLAQAREDCRNKYRLSPSNTRDRIIIGFGGGGGVEFNLV